jgi:hypothetical protein
MFSQIDAGSDSGKNTGRLSQECPENKDLKRRAPIAI